MADNNLPVAVNTYTSLNHIWTGSNTFNTITVSGTNYNGTVKVYNSNNKAYVSSTADSIYVDSYVRIGNTNSYKTLDVYGDANFYNDGSQIKVIMTDITTSTTPTVDTHSASLVSCDSAGKTIGYTSSVYRANGNITNYFVANNPNAPSNKKTASLAVTVTPTGIPLTYAPTPPANDNSTQIATTEWVRDCTPKVFFNVNDKHTGTFSFGYNWGTSIKVDRDCQFTFLIEGNKEASVGLDVSYDNEKFANIIHIHPSLSWGQIPYTVFAKKNWYFRVRGIENQSMPTVRYTYFGLMH